MEQNKITMLNIDMDFYMQKARIERSKASIALFSTVFQAIGSLLKMNKKEMSDCSLNLKAPAQ
ncbi:MAG: hypothetical protein OQK35_01265 [Alphaproteobacteria bacterium]|nr:hypothetical protein [Rhodospirillales bacterium]MCW9044939.1 hypothetical protein [Alphaproteobacteria bacterium]